MEELEKLEKRLFTFEKRLIDVAKESKRKIGRIKERIEAKKAEIIAFKSK